MPTGLSIEPDRIRRNSADDVNRRIDERTAANIRQYSTQPPQAIDRRIRELNREWDIEQVLETNASTLALVGVALGAAVSRRWLLLSGTVLGFLLWHGIQGWCPPLPLFRRAGVRTRTEIDREKLALKYLRGDFEERTAEQPMRQRRRLGALDG